MVGGGALLEERVVWVTGAGSGIGRATALAFARAGGRVALTGRRAEALEETAARIREHGGEALIVPADLIRPGAIGEAHREIVKVWGDPDVLVNNAGLNITRRHWHELTPADAARVVALLLNAPFELSLAVLPAMRRRGGGTLIHIASLAGIRLYPVSGPSYTAAKTGMVAMSDSLNAEEGIHGIRSICICPGEAETPILDSRPKPPSSEARALMLQPDDVAAAALFCATLPPRACVSRLVLQPTDESSARAEARAIESR